MTITFEGTLQIGTDGEWSVGELVDGASPVFDDSSRPGAAVRTLDQPGGRRVIIWLINQIAA